MTAGNARIGVIGTGWWASNHHIPALKAHPRADVVALVDADEERARTAAEWFEVDIAHKSHLDLLARDDIDGVVVATPHTTHHAIVRDALAAEKHVLVEKPMALRGEDAWELVERAQRVNRHLVVGNTFQFTSHAKRAHEIVRSGQLGELRFVSGLFASHVQQFLRTSGRTTSTTFPPQEPGPATYSDPAVAGGGMGHTQVTHAMAMVFWVTGARATAVSALMENFDLNVDLADAITYRLDSGAIGTMGAVGSLMPDQPRQQELRYYGTNGVLLQELIGGRLAYNGNDGTVETPPDLVPGDNYPTRAPARLLVDLVLGIVDDNPAPATDAAACVEFLEAAYTSAGSGGPVAVAPREPTSAASAGAEPEVRPNPDPA